MPSPESMRIMQELESLETLSQGFSTALEEGVKSRDLGSLEALRQELEIKRDALRDKLNPFESTINLKEQYKSQWEILERTGVLKSLSSGERGIVGIDGEDYPMPSYEEIVKRMKENKEVLSTKIEQGFTKLLIVPFGVQINYLKMIYSNALLLHHARGKLFRTKKDPNEADVKLDLDKDNPFYTWDDLDREKLAYYPKKFDRNDHGGKTKEQLLAEEQTGWHILLIEDMPNIPRKKEDIKTVGGRVQIDNTASSMRSYIHIGEEFPSADEYLRGLQESPIYLHEQGFTPEDQIMYVLSYLEETSQVLDTASEGRPETLLLGAYSKSHGMVPTFYWSLLNNRTRIEKIFQQGRNWDFGIRTSVKI